MLTSKSSAFSILDTAKAEPTPSAPPIATIAQSIACNQAENISSRRAQCHPHANLVPPLNRHERDQAIEPHNRKQQPRARKKRKQRRFETRAVCEPAHRLVERLHLHRDTRIDRSNLRSHPRFYGP